MLSGSMLEIDAVRAQDEAIDGLHGHIVTYLGRIAATELSPSRSAELMRLMETANSLENIDKALDRIAEYLPTLKS